MVGCRISTSMSVEFFVHLKCSYYNIPKTHLLSTQSGTNTTWLLGFQGLATVSLRAQHL